MNLLKVINLVHDIIICIANTPKRIKNEFLSSRDIFICENIKIMIKELIPKLKREYS